MAKAKYINIPLFRERLRYEPNTGHLVWLVDASTRAPAGSVAGYTNKLGYVIVRVDGVNYYAHRVAWALMTGRQPESVIDHINGNPSDNRWENLRDVSYSENLQNSDRHTGRARGVIWRERSRKWQAQICVNRKRINLGFFVDHDDAVTAYQSARKKYHPAYARET